MADQPNPVDMHHLTFERSELVGSVLPDRADPDEVMVARSYRLPVELDRWIADTAAAKGIKASTLVRDLLELGRAAVEGSERTVALSDVLRALASVRSVDAA